VNYNSGARRTRRTAGERGENLRQRIITIVMPVPSQYHISVNCDKGRTARDKGEKENGLHCWPPHSLDGPLRERVR
jgi:hypothetical protein